MDEDEQIIKTLGVRVAALGEYAVRQTFDGAVQDTLAGVQGNVPESALVSAAQGHGAKIVLKKDSLTILGVVFTPPFTLSQLTEKLGPARIVLQNGTRKSPMTGRESPYTQALALWDEL